MNSGTIQKTTQKIILLVLVSVTGLMTCLLTGTIVYAAAPAKVVRYAAAVVQRYDQNNDGVLHTQEWETMTGSPQSIDIDGDGQVTKGELVWFLEQFGQRRTIYRPVAAAQPEPYKFDPAQLKLFRPVLQRAPVPAPPEPSESSESGTNIPSESTEENTQEGNIQKGADVTEEAIQANEQPMDEEVYQKMLLERQIPSNRPYHVLPESIQGVPAWFLMSDKDGDGQISLSEFAPALSPASVRLFKQHDKNNDGFIEPNEVRRQ